MRDVMSVRLLMGKASTSSCTHTHTNSHKLSALRSEFWLLFRSQAKGIMFYDVPVTYVKEELRFRCELEPFNRRNANSSSTLDVRCMHFLWHGGYLSPAKRLELILASKIRLYGSRQRRSMLISLAS